MRTSRTGSRRRDNSLGFTLLELAIVVLIIGVFTAFLSIRIENVLTGGDLRLASRMIIGEIQKLRGTAAYTHREQVLTFDLDENTFFVRFDPKMEEGILSEEASRAFLEPQGEKLPKGVRLEDVIIPYKGKLKEGRVGIVFFENGSVEPALIHLRNEAEEVFTLEINPLTGRVTIHETYIERKTAA